jgi:hypothetical protein
MKIFFRIFLFLGLISFPLSAQNKFDAFGAAAVKFTSLSNQSVLILGGKFGLVINKSIILGGGFYGLINNVSANYIDAPSGQQVIMNLNYGGLELEYIFFPDSKVHGSLEILLAGGGVYFEVPDKSIPHNSYSKDNFLLYEPSVNIEFNAVTWLHIDLSFSYLIITSYDAVNYGIDKNDLNGATVGLVFKFGSY